MTHVGVKQVQSRRAAPRPRSKRRPMTVWGASPPQIHDSMWASRRIQVVRPGQVTKVHDGAELYLLLRSSDIVLFDPLEIVRSLRWLNPSVMRLRIVDVHNEAYTELMESDEDGTFHRIVRRYSPETHATTQAWLTSRAEIAAAWASAPDERAAKSAVLRVTKARGAVASKVVGRIFDGARPEEHPACLSALITTWRDPGRMFEGVFQFSPGVWVHETCHVPRSARLIGSHWIGTHVSLDSGELYVGPKAVADAEGRRPQVRPIDWSDVAAPEWRFVPPLGERPFARVAKRIFDISFAGAVLLVTALLYPIIMAMILIEDGRPVFFAHRRQTIGGREFPCYKFRTMRKDAERLKEQLQAQNQADGPQFFMENDPRLLRCGRFLRRYQLDELPQFWNVLVGHMSVVGPRPSPDKENQYCPAWREARLSVRPGVTGLWQISRTRLPQTDFQEWIKYDLEYVQRASLRLDIWIILNTFKKLLGR